MSAPTIGWVDTSRAGDTSRSRHKFLSDSRRSQHDLRRHLSSHRSNVRLPPGQCNVSNGLRVLTTSVELPNGLRESAGRAYWQTETRSDSLMVGLPQPRRGRVSALNGWLSGLTFWEQHLLAAHFALITAGVS